MVHQKGKKGDERGGPWHPTSRRDHDNRRQRPQRLQQARMALNLAPEKKRANTGHKNKPIA